jgi:hypothetical protein
VTPRRYLNAVDGRMAGLTLSPLSARSFPGPAKRLSGGYHRQRGRIGGELSGEAAREAAGIA